MRDIRITRKCSVCGDVMFWKREEFHCKYCKIPVYFPVFRLIQFIQEDYVTVPDEVNVS